MEQLAAADGTAFNERTLGEQEQLWQRAKQTERKP
jgi:ATP diphosphatase